jgi:2-polyprenyl-3-methyl-5-hydroxy-6-metoxy-1,4-benzoquinol methylase
MGVPYKHNFSNTDVYRKYVRQQIKSKKHIIGEDGVPVSLEYLDRERDKEFYDESWATHPDRDKIASYMVETANLISEHNGDPKRVLEVGAGCGGMVVEFFNRFNPEKYVAYEFSDAAKKITQKVTDNELKNVSVIQDSFKDLNDFSEYDTIIALEIFEHIGWDLEFISKIPSGKWLFFSVPVKHAKDHVRAFIDHKSIVKRYGDMLDVKEVRSLCLHKDMYKWWCVASQKK